MSDNKLANEYTIGGFEQMQKLIAELEREKAELQYQISEAADRLERNIAEKHKAFEALNASNHQNIELVAKVEVFKSVVQELANTEHQHGGALQPCGQFSYRVKEYLFKEAKKALELSQTQCLNQIKAEAVTDFVQHIKSLFESGEYSEIARAYFRKANSGARGQVISLADDPEWCGIIAAKQHYLASIAKGE
jgi:hypothetical protein